MLSVQFWLESNLYIVFMRIYKKTNYSWEIIETEQETEQEKNRAKKKGYLSVKSLKLYKKIISEKLNWAKKTIEYNVSDNRSNRLQKGPRGVTSLNNH